MPFAKRAKQKLNESECKWSIKVNDKLILREFRILLILQRVWRRLRPCQKVYLLKGLKSPRLFGKKSIKLLTKTINTTTIASNHKISWSRHCVTIWREKKGGNKFDIFCEWNQSACGWTKPTEYPNLLYNREKKSISFNNYLNAPNAETKTRKSCWKLIRKTAGEEKKIFGSFPGSQSVVNLSRRAEFFGFKWR